MFGKLWSMADNTCNAPPFTPILDPPVKKIPAQAFTVNGRLPGREFFCVFLRHGRIHIKFETWQSAYEILRLPLAFLQKLRRMQRGL